MCNQTAGLIARALEEFAIATVTISLLRYITEKVKPPRALETPFGFGYPLGEPDNRKLQKQILFDCFKMLEKVEVPGTIWDFEKQEF